MNTIDVVLNKIENFIFKNQTEIAFDFYWEIMRITKIISAKSQLKI